MAGEQQTHDERIFDLLALAEQQQAFAQEGLNALAEARKELDQEREAFKKAIKAQTDGLAAAIAKERAAIQAAAQEQEDATGKVRAFYSEAREGVVKASREAAGEAARVATAETMAKALKGLREAESDLLRAKGQERWKLLAVAVAVGVLSSAIGAGGVFFLAKPPAISLDAKAVADHLRPALIEGRRR